MEQSKAQAQKPEPKSQAHSKISFKKGLVSSLTPQTSMLAQCKRIVYCRLGLFVKSGLELTSVSFQLQTEIERTNAFLDVVSKPN